MARAAGPLLVLAAAVALAQLPSPARAADSAIPAIPLDLVVASPAVTDGFLADQLAALPEVYAAHGLSFTVTTRRTWPASGTTPADRHIDTRSDRDALAAEFHPGAANVFLTASLEDVDEANRHRFGVCWRNQTDPTKRYVVVASYAPRGVLAHELGHLLGLSHVAQPDNVMSYTRTGAPPFFLAAQAETMRRTARADFADGTFRRDAK